MLLKVIACEVAFREICYAAARSINLIAPEFHSQGYHDNPFIGRRRIQECIDAVPEGKYDAILLGYGLCNHILEDIRARHTPVVAPRAHDCITFFLGSKERYCQHFLDNSGTYYYTTGWLEYRDRGGERPQRPQGAEMGTQTKFEELAAKYGEDNARYLMESLGAWKDHYSRGCYIHFDFTGHLPCREQVIDICRQRNWEYEELQGDISLLQRWLDGDWDPADFLVIPPGHTVHPTYDENIVGVRRDGAESEQTDADSLSQPASAQSAAST